MDNNIKIQLKLNCIKHMKLQPRNFVIIKSCIQRVNITFICTTCYASIFNCLIHIFFHAGTNVLILSIFVFLPLSNSFSQAFSANLQDLIASCLVAAFLLIRLGLPFSLIYLLCIRHSHELSYNCLTLPSPSFLFAIYRYFFRYCYP